MTGATIKISKYLSQAGIASRREGETLVKQGLVSVNGKKITNPAVRINPEKDKVAYRGKILAMENKVYYLLNKPLGYTCTAQDPHAKKLIVALVPKEPKVWPVGRLDKMTSGLIVMTNDGDLTLKLTHPRYEMEKEYELSANHSLSPAEIKTIQKGVSLEDGFIRPDRFEQIGPNRYRITIHSGKKRVVRRIIEKVGKSVVKLKRIRAASLVLGDLPAGKWRRLSEKEIQIFKQ
jgi:23S rRNA pseudouridine2605 synthase